MCVHQYALAEGHCLGCILVHEIYNITPDRRSAIGCEIGVLQMYTFLTTVQNHPVGINRDSIATLQQKDNDKTQLLIAE